jgi:pyruvate,orthophosphate dikinase
MLQTRSAKRTAAAAVKIAVDMVEEGIITPRDAVSRIEPAHVDQLLRATFDPGALAKATKIVNGLNASPGAAVGRAVFDADMAVEWANRGERVILVRIETSPDASMGWRWPRGSSPLAAGPPRTRRWSLARSASPASRARRT